MRLQFYPFAAAGTDKVLQSLFQQHLHAIGQRIGIGCGAGDDAGKMQDVGHA